MSTFSRIYVVLFSMLAVLQFATHITTIEIDLSSVSVFITNAGGVYILIASMNSWAHVRRWMAYLYSTIFLVIMFRGSGWILQDSPKIFVTIQLKTE